MIEPTKDDIGRKVLYRDQGRKTIEEGTLVAFNTAYAFVRYGNDAHSKATHLEDIEWMSQCK